MSYEAVIGLEVHAQLLTESKIFCGCSTRFGNDPNTNTCPVCMGFPGVLPVLNKKAVEHTIRAGLATHCEIALQSRWARKNYFYPDLPKGYQISQYEEPLCEHGHVEIETEDSGSKRVGLTRIHMEEDAGKNIHDARGRSSLVDLNRAGVPLMEIVSEPDIRSAAEASAYLKTLKSILEYLEVCDGNMEEGSLRCDANVSLREAGSDTLGVKTEIKNLNSFRSVERALEYEIARQAEILSDGGRIVQETRLWDADREMTRAMRSKESAHDYRYFPEPDLLPLVIDRGWIEELAATLPELPRERSARFVRDYGLSRYDAAILTAKRDVADYFEEAVGCHNNAKAISNWVTGDLFRILKDSKLDSGLHIETWPIPAPRLASLVRMIDDGRINGKIAKNVFAEMLTSGQTPEAIVADKGLEQVTDTGAIDAAVDEVISLQQAQVAEYKAGKEKVFGFLVGQVMQKTKGKANPRLVNEILKTKLELQ